MKVGKELRDMVRAFLLVALLLSYSGSFLCLNEEGFLLLAFKNAIRDDPQNVTGNWNSSQETPCSWDGVMCKQGRVVSLSMPKNQLLGSLPSTLGSLRYLRHINLRNNRLYGGLPVELFQLEGLQSLVLYGNSLSGALPAEVGELRYLQNLDLSDNFLSGFIPSSLLNCTRLRTLMVGHNNFVGVLPTEFGANFSDLQMLNLSYNGFEGPIPSEIGSLFNLQGTLDLSHNIFSGQIPASLGDLPENVYIDLTYNNLSGTIPRNGSLDNRGAAAYIGNPGLCGLPLKNRCPGDSPGLPLPTFPRPTFSGVATSRSKHKKLTTGSIVAIVLGDAIGIALVVFIFVACYARVATRRGNRDQPNTDKIHRGKHECLCFRKDESETPSENMEQLDLVPLDVQVGFDLDELLRAPAFILGKSEIGIVYKVVLGNGLTLAVRRLGEGGSQRFREFQLEVEAIGRIRHSNIVALRAYYWSDDEKLLICDYIPNGSLASAIHGKSENPLLWEVRAGIAKGLAKGLAYLHGFSPRKYVHGDLKPTNVLLGENMEPYISDFGLARLANIAGGSPGLQSNRVPTDNRQQQSSESAANLIVSPRSLYQAPEAPKLLKPSQKWDVYSYGVILLELITGRSTEVLMSTSEVDIVSWVQLCMDEKKPFSDVVDPVLLRQMQMEEEMIGVFKIALQCVNSNPERRPSMRNVSDLLDRLTCTS